MIRFKSPYGRLKPVGIYLGLQENYFADKVHNGNSILRGIHIDWWQARQSLGFMIRFKSPYGRLKPVGERGI